MKKIIIIGGGVAGLSAGIYARNNQFDVEIYEKNSNCGGECWGWQRGEYRIDNCIHVLTGTSVNSPLYKVWKKVGALTDTTKIIQGEYLFKSKQREREIAFYKDLERTRTEMLSLSLTDASEIHSFINDVKRMASFEIPSKLPIEYMSPYEMFQLGKKMKDVAKIVKKYGKINLYEYAKRFQDPLLRMAFTDYLPGEYAAYTLFAMYSFFASGNGGIPEGGSIDFSIRMMRTFVNLGGRIKYDSEVREIVIENNQAVGIRLKNGRICRADYIIAACDMYETFFHLLLEKFQSQKIIDIYRDHKKNFVTSGMVVAFGVDGQMEEANGTIHFDCKELKVAERSIHRIQIHNYNYQKKFAPEGKTVIECHIFQYPSDYLYWRELYKNQEKYTSMKLEIAQQVMDRIAMEYPKYKNKFTLLDVWTPMSFERYCNAYAGSYMSFPPTKTCTGLSLSGKIKEVKHLYMATQWQMSGGGLPVAVTMGKFAIQGIMKEEGVRKKVWKEI